MMHSRCLFDDIFNLECFVSKVVFSFLSLYLFYFILPIGIKVFPIMS